MRSTPPHWRIKQRYGFNEGNGKGEIKLVKQAEQKTGHHESSALLKKPL